MSDPKNESEVGSEEPLKSQAAESPTAPGPESPTAPGPESPAPSGAESPSDPVGKSPGTRKVSRGVLLGAGAAVLVVVALALGAFVWPGWLAGPGKADDEATAAISALSSKDAGALDKVACHTPDGKALAQLPPQAMQLIQSATSAGPPTLVIDTQAQQPITLTISAQGQTQNLPANVLLGVDDGQWCMLGLSMRQ